jgi:hypothetical protein
MLSLIFVRGFKACHDTAYIFSLIRKDKAHSDPPLRRRAQTDGTSRHRVLLTPYQRLAPQ